NYLWAATIYEQTTTLPLSYVTEYNACIYLVTPKFISVCMVDDFDKLKPFSVSEIQTPKFISVCMVDDFDKLKPFSVPEIQTPKFISVCMVDTELYLYLTMFKSYKNVVFLQSLCQKIFGTLPWNFHGICAFELFVLKRILSRELLCMVSEFLRSNNINLVRQSFTNEYPADHKQLESTNSMEIPWNSHGSFSEDLYSNCGIESNFKIVLLFLIHPVLQLLNRVRIKCLSKIMNWIGKNSIFLVFIFRDNNHSSKCNEWGGPSAAVVIVVVVLPLRETPPPLLRKDIWEIPRRRVELGKKLGEGAFGFVFKAIVTTGENSSETKVVAVKMVKEEASSSDRQDLLAELEIMKKLKPHPNVVSLIGAVLNEVNCPFVVVEFVPFGDLLGYLRKVRGVQDSCYFDADHQPKTKLCTSQELMKFAIESAQGMEYLSMKKSFTFFCLKIVHRDLAARNVLVGSGKTCKITDFGMARDIRRSEIYMRTRTKKNKGLIPVKWTAIESILRGIYTTRSDVWSFGILLFEILTVGGSPYPGMNGYQVRDFISQGKRIPKPMHVDNELYQVMMDCWHPNPRKRPTFKQLGCNLRTMRSEVCGSTGSELHVTTTWFAAWQGGLFGKTEHGSIHYATRGEIWNVSPIGPFDNRFLKQYVPKTLLSRTTYTFEALALPHFPLNAEIPSEDFSMNLWNAAGALQRPNGIRTHSYKPQGVIKAFSIVDAEPKRLVLFPDTYYRIKRSWHCCIWDTPNVIIVLDAHHGLGFISESNRTFTNFTSLVYLRTILNGFLSQFYWQEGQGIVSSVVTKNGT
ncbi:proto-oncogene tyrosine- kinase receptor Ret-like, partial [Paramuricea clavata]